MERTDKQKESLAKAITARWNGHTKATYQEQLKANRERRRRKRDVDGEYVREYDRKQYEKHKERKRANCRDYYRRHTKEVKRYITGWKSENKDRVRESNNKSDTRCRDECNDSYVRGVLSSHGSPLAANDWPQELVEAKRAQIQLRRAIRNGNHRQTDNIS